MVDCEKYSMFCETGVIKENQCVQGEEYILRKYVYTEKSHVQCILRKQCSRKTVYAGKICSEK